MRIVAGKYKSRIIKAPSNNDLTRPTSDKTREAIFNIISPYLYGAKVLDLFAGSGAFGIESLSRDASFVTFVDNNEFAIKTIKENLKSLNIIDNFKIIKDDYKIIKTMDKFDVILLDPPYKLDVIDEILDIIKEKDLLEEHGIIVYESDINHQIKEEKEGYNLKIKKYGIAYVNILYKK